MTLATTGLTASDLAHVTLFRGVDPERVLELLHDCPIRRLETDDILLLPDEINDTLFVILEGRLQVFLDEPEGLSVSSLGPGECAGEMSIVDHRPTSAVVVAQESSLVLAIPQDLVWALVDTIHSVAHNLLYILSGRLRRGNIVIAAGYEERRRFERFATEDNLTGLNNRRWFDEALGGIITACKTEGLPFSLVMLDVDYFKRFNDKYGHPAGDKVLQKIARVVKANMRPHDMAARYGGEEFVVLLPKTGMAEGVSVAERLRLAVAKAEFQDEAGRPLPMVTISLGVAEMASGVTPEDLVKNADEALYRAKNGGRNRVSR